jgi:uncharacterized membrane protein
MFRYLRAYDDRVIFLNLASLFFIVTFPFSASVITHSRPSFMLPMIIYFGNVTMIFVTNFLLSHYIFKHKTSLSVPGFEAEKKYIYIVNLAFAIGLGCAFLIILISGLLMRFEENAMTISYGAVAILLFGLRRWTKRFKPKKQLSVP